MASLPCLPQTCDMYANAMRSLSLTSHATRSHDEQRCVVRLNVPTVATLRRQSVISNHTVWSKESSNMPLSAGEPSQTSFLPPYLSVSGDASNARLIGGPVPFSQHAGGPHSAADSTLEARDPASASAESSPTTTISTTDSLLTGSSPGSSPESPTSSLPMHPFIATKSPSISENVNPPTSHPFGAPAPGFDSDSSGRRARNIRNLAINTKGISTRPATTASVVNGERKSTAPAGEIVPVMPGNAPVGNKATSLSEPASPSFIIPQARKRPSKMGLTISTDSTQAIPNTPGYAASFALRRQNANIPETPALKRFPTLRESEVTMFSPTAAPLGGMTFPPPRSMDLALPTPSLGPQGGMTLPPISRREPSPPRPNSRPMLSLSSKPSFEGGSGASVIQHTVEHTPEVPFHDLPLSREVKSPSYPEGPACIYSPNVFLYHQPTADQAREFDVIINVAREVPNPFVEEAEAQQKAQRAKGYVDMGTQCDLLNAPPLKPLAPRYEEPETPKAFSPRRKEPEYIHLPWEHNSRVYDSWLETCQLIDARAKAGQRVLIHCQLGVSRSASLIVAYGMYLNPSLMPDEAREQAKQRSRWIDLNMHFMYELGDFRKILLEHFPETVKSPAPPTLGRTRTEIAVPTSSDFEDESRRPSITEAYGKDEPLSAPGDANWSPTEPSLHEDSFDIKEPEDSSDVPTPIRAEAKLEIQEVPLPEIKADDDSIKPLEFTMGMAPRVDSIEPQVTSLPPPKDDGLDTSPLFSSRLRNPAKDLSNLSELQPSQPATTTAQPPTSMLEPEKPEESAPPVPRRLRPVPSMPAGFHSIRKVSPNLTLNTSAMVKPAIGAPELPPLDFGNSLMSPRTSEFVANPFHRNSLAGDLAGLDGILSPATVEYDPRSPPQKGEHPITRNIDDVL